MTNLDDGELERWQVAQRQACEAERIAALRWPLHSPTDREFLHLRSRELRLRADCLLAEVVARARKRAGRRAGVADTATAA